MGTFKYEKSLKTAIQQFWKTRQSQTRQQKQRNVNDQGTRGAVTGGKQLDGLVLLLKKIAIDAGAPEKCIYTKGNVLPGFFRPTKDWDFIIISPKGKLVACLEFKSQVGSFGNNFNNRSEEAIGSAVDIWTAFREKVFPDDLAPWLGYLMVVEKSVKSARPVSVSEPHFKVLKEFVNTSYLDRYGILCRKLILERLYTSATVIWTEEPRGGVVKYGYMNNDLSFETFVNSFIGYLSGRATEFRGKK
jgi:hypothetical protein